MIEALIERPFARITAGNDLRLLKLGSTFTVAVGTPSVKIHGTTFTAVSRSDPEFLAEHDTRTCLIGCQPRVDASSRKKKHDGRLKAADREAQARRDTRRNRHRRMSCMLGPSQSSWNKNEIFYSGENRPQGLEQFSHILSY